MRVFKFGGASVKDAQAIRHVATIIKSYSDEELLVVVSAMGKTTNAIEKILNLFVGSEPTYVDEIQSLKKFHFDILKDLYPSQDPSAFHQLEDLFLQFEWFFELGEKENYDFLYDQVVGFGEIFSTKIISTYLQSQQIKAKWLDARNFIITNDTYREATVDFSVSEKVIGRKIPKILANEVVITQGFIGKNRSGHSTTLGREGSDYSAAIYAWALHAKELTIWKDVPGILSADPKKVEHPTLFKELSYRQTVEMSYYGASVLHPKTIQPLQNRDIPLHVRSFVHPEQTGTKVTNESQENVDIPILISKENQCLMHLSAKNFSFLVEENFSRIFKILAENRIKINLMRNSAMRFTLCCDYNEKKIQDICSELDSDFLLEYSTGHQLMTIRNATESFIKPLISTKKILVEQRIEQVVQVVMA